MPCVARLPPAPICVTTRPHDVERLAPVLLAAARLSNERRIAMNRTRQRGTSCAPASTSSAIPSRAASSRSRRSSEPSSSRSSARAASSTRSRSRCSPIDIPPPPPPPGIRGILRARAGNALINSIRDIDLATQLDHERFLVLLPYTDLKGAAHVGRRIIAAVSAERSGRLGRPHVRGARRRRGRGSQEGRRAVVREADEGCISRARAGPPRRRRARGAAVIAYVIGWPIEHSRSPAMLNAAFAHLGIAATMEKRAVAPEDLARVPAHRCRRSA